MWLMYPVQRDDVRDARRGVAALLTASALWYSALTLAVGGWTAAVLAKVQNKFVQIDGPEPRNWTPFLILFAAFGGAGLLRALGYRLSRNVVGALAVPEAATVSMIGAAIWMASIGTLYMGFTGMIPLVAAVGTAVETRFLRYPASLFRLVVSPRAADRLKWVFTARTAYLAFLVAASMVILFAHAVNEIPRTPNGPYDQTIHRVNSVLYIVFRVAVVGAVALLPLVTGMYWWVLAAVYAALPRLVDSTGPVVQPEPPPRPGFEQLKQVLKPQSW